MDRAHRPPNNFASLIFALLSALGIWLVFYPGIFSADSIYFVFESTSGLYSDWHSPLIPFFLELVPNVESNIGLVTLLQILAGLLGIRRLAIAFTRFMGIGEEFRNGFALFNLALFSSPLTPLPVYLATLWTDTWLAVLLVWIAALLIEMRGLHEPEIRENSISKAVLVTLLVSMAVMVRSNTPVLYPALALVLWVVLDPKLVTKFQRIVLIVLPVVLYSIFMLYQNMILDVKHGHAEHAIYALDMASMIVYDPSICQDLSLRSCDLVLDVFSQDFIIGDGAIDFTMNQGRKAYVPYYDLLYHPGLENEYFTAVTEHPRLWITVKILNFIDYVGPDESRYFYQKKNLPNYEGFARPHLFAPLTDLWFALTDRVLQDPVLRWLSFVHAIWLIVNFLGLVICAWLGRLNKRARFVGLLLLVPASYYGSYLIAFTSSEFRFMYPAMLLVQVITLTWLLSRAAQVLRRSPTEPLSAEPEPAG